MLVEVHVLDKDQTVKDVVVVDSVYLDVVKVVYVLH